MKKINKIILTTIISIVLTSMFYVVNAASASITTSKKTMKVGETAKITLSFKAAAWNIHVSGAVTYDAVDASSDAKNTSKSVTLKFTPKKVGNYSITLSGDVTDADERDESKKIKDVNQTINITVKEKSSTTTTTDDTQEPSTNANLKNLGITPNDFSGFKAAQLNYSTEVPKSVEKINVYATAADPKATITGTGSKTLKIGDNNFEVKVTAADKKTTKTYKLRVKRKSEDEISNDATLSNLGIRPKEYDFTGFKQRTTDYSVKVPNKVEKITIYASSSNSKATIQGIGEKKLEVGENKYQIKVTAEDKKTTMTYNLKVTREEEKEDEEEPEEPVNTTTKFTGITGITVDGYDLEPEFDAETYQYTVELPSGTTELDVIPKTQGDYIETEVVGNKDLQNGINVITILARDTNNDSTTTYQITADVGDKEKNLQVLNSEIEQAQKELISLYLNVKIRKEKDVIIFLKIIFNLDRFYN